MADFIITIRPEPDASLDVDWLRRYQVLAMAAPVIRVEQQSFDLPIRRRFKPLFLPAATLLLLLLGLPVLTR